MYRKKRERIFTHTCEFHASHSFLSECGMQSFPLLVLEWCSPTSHESHRCRSLFLSCFSWYLYLFVRHVYQFPPPKRGTREIKCEPKGKLSGRSKEGRKRQRRNELDWAKV